MMPDQPRVWTQAERDARIPPPERQALIREFLAGASTGELAARTGRHRASIERVLRETIERLAQRVLQVQHAPEGDGAPAGEA